MKIFKLFTILLMSIFYVRIGVHHFLDPEYFLNIMPPFLPYHLELVYISGFFEILFGILLMFQNTRAFAGKGLIILLIAVFPANIYLAQTNGAALGISPLIAWGRLPFQFVFIGLAYWHTKEQIKRGEV